MTKPPCFKSEEQYARWKEAARATNLNAKCAWCRDCTPEYQLEMIREDKCIRPDVSFVIGEDGMLEGVIPTGREMSDITAARLTFLEVTF